MLNSQYTFDGLYLGCVAENMEELHPFGDVPRKLASSVKRSLVAARALVKALRTGHEIANQMTKVRTLGNFVKIFLVSRKEKNFKSQGGTWKQGPEIYFMQN